MSCYRDRLLCAVALFSVAVLSVATNAAAQTPASVAAKLHAAADWRPPIVWYFGAADPSLALALADEHTSVQVIARDESSRDACLAAVADKKQLGRIQVGLADDWTDMAGWAPRVVSAAVLDDAFPGIEPAALARAVNDRGVVALIGGGRSLRSGLQAAGMELVAGGSADMDLLRDGVTAGLDDWPMYRHDAGQTGRSADTEAGPPQVPRWIAGAALGELPAVAGHRLVYCVDMLSADEQRRQPNISQAHRVVAREAATGGIVWQRVLSLARPGGWNWDGAGGIKTALLVVGDELLVRQADGIARFAARDGSPRGTIPAKGVWWLTQTEETLLFSTPEWVQAWELTGESPRWTISGAGRCPMVGQQTVVRMETDGVSAYAVADGRLRWRKSAAEYPEAALRGVFGDAVMISTEKRGADKKRPETTIHLLGLADGDVRWHVTGLHSNQANLNLVTWAQGKFHVPSHPVKGGPESVLFHKIKSVNIGCQLASSTDKYLLFKDHGGLSVADGPFCFIGNWTLGKADCGTQVMLAYGNAFLSAKDCGCRGAGLWMRAGGPLRETGDPLLGTEETIPTPLRAEPAAAAHPVVRGPVDAAGLLAAHPQATGWGHVFGTPARDAVAGGARPGGTIAWTRDDLLRGVASEVTKEAYGGQRLTAPVMAYGIACLAEIESGTVFGLDPQTGRTRWTFTADSRVTAAPVLHRGLCLVGTESGWVVALEAATGRLCWRTRVAPGVRPLPAHGRIGSLWPVNTALMADQGMVFGTAGHHYNWANGVRGFALDLATGNPVWVRVVRSNVGMFRTIADGIVITPDDSATGGWFGGYGLTTLNPRTGEVATTDKMGVVALPGRAVKTNAALEFQAPNGVLRVVGGNGLQEKNGSSLGYREGMREAKPVPDAQLPFSIRALARFGVAGERAIVAVGAVTDRAGTRGMSATVTISDAGEWTVASGPPFPSPPIVNGLAVADGHMVVVGEDHSVSGFQ